MKKFFILLTAILILSANAVAQDNNSNTITNSSNKVLKTQTVIDFSTGGKTGHLVYREEYYVKGNSGELQLDKLMTYFDGDINKTLIRLRISRPLDKQGKQYSNSMVKAIATLNNETILEGFYKDQPKNSTGNTNTNKPTPSDASVLKKLPGLDTPSALGAIVLIFAVFLRRRT